MKMVSLVVALAIAPGANATLNCKDYLSLPDAERLVFVRGLHDGVAATLGITTAFAAQLAARAGTDDERDGIQKMYISPQAFLSQGCCHAESAIQEAIAKSCGLDPALPAGTVFIDVLSAQKVSDK